MRDVTSGFPRSLLPPWGTRLVAVAVAVAALLAACGSTPIGPSHQLPPETAVNQPGAAAPFVAAAPNAAPATR